MSGEQVYYFPWGKRIVKPTGEVVEVRDESRLRHSDDNPTVTAGSSKEDRSATEAIVSGSVQIPRGEEPWWSGLGATRVDSMF